MRRLKSFFISIVLGANVEEIFNRAPFCSWGEMRLLRRLRRGQTWAAGTAIDTWTRSFP